MIYKFIKDKEYNIYVDNYIISEWNDWHDNITFVRSYKDQDKIDHYVFHNHYLNKEYDYKVGRIIKVTEPVSAIEFFKMYTHWSNYSNESRVHYDPVYASDYANKIHNILGNRGWVIYGSGKFESYDDNLMLKFQMATVDVGS